MSQVDLKEKKIKTAHSDIFYYTDTSAEDNRTVVFLHGLSANHTTWLNLLPIFRNAGFNTLSPDLRGHGKSDKEKRRENYKLDVFTSDLLQMFNAEKLDKVILVGYSFGGLIAMDFADKHPERVENLILVSSGMGNPAKYMWFGFIKKTTEKILEVLAWALRWQKRKEYIYYRHGASRNYWHSVWIGLNTMPLDVNIWLFRMQFAELDFAPVLPRMKVPVLLVKGAKDPFLSDKEAGDMLKLLPQAKLVSSPRLGHFVASRSQAELAEIILNYLRK